MGTIIYTSDPNELYHFGIKRRSGRYPWGSGDRPYQGEEKQAPKKEDKYEKKEVARLKTYSVDFGRKAIITALATVGGISIGVGTSNPILGATGMAAIAGVLRASPVGKKVIYYKK